MTKAKQELSTEERKKAEEERTRPFRMEIADVGNETFSIKSPILLSKEQYELLNKICEITDEQLQEYIKEALLTRVQVDLENPTQFGQDVCETLLKRWNPK